MKKKKNKEYKIIDGIKVKAEPIDYTINEAGKKIPTYEVVDFEVTGINLNVDIPDADLANWKEKNNNL